ncbi:MAG TPA: hypothetical protein PLL30_07835 [Candidatus Krumholzibacteria bacterium]|nr:hypothetical protein [Candidatus Krumholzibacteria bacterium]HPD71667.1 hypothetical protein [Candidatus Krumholzibacteria bacterium]HRY41400.1 hypothetical protein [Candidatus Krumholzibacteria bacterium]
MTFGILTAAGQGIQQNQRLFANAARDLVQSATFDPTAPATVTNAPDLAASTARLLAARRGLEACLAVARVGRELLGTVIDVLA